LFIVTTACHQRQVTEMTNKAKASLAAVVGLEGPMKNVVFVVDMSGSMEQHVGKWRPRLEAWLTTLPFQRFNVLVYADDVHWWHADDLCEATEASRSDAIDFVRGQKPHGSTNTLDAVRQALQRKTVDTVILLSDGAPTATDGQDSSTVIPRILQTARELNSTDPRITINTIGIGNYFSQQFGTFLRTLAEQHRGTFIGL